MTTKQLLKSHDACERVLGMVLDLYGIKSTEELSAESYAKLCQQATEAIMQYFNKAVKPADMKMLKEMLQPDLKGQIVINAPA